MINRKEAGAVIRFLNQIDYEQFSNLVTEPDRNDFLNGMAQLRALSEGRFGEPREDYNARN